MASEVEKGQVLACLSPPLPGESLFTSINQTENVSTHLKQASSFSSALQKIQKKIELIPCETVKISIRKHVADITHENFLKLKELFMKSHLYLIHIRSKKRKNVNNLFFWCSEDRQKIFILQLENENGEMVTDFVRIFLLSSLKNGHNGLVSNFETEQNQLKVSVEIFSLGDSRGSLLSIAAEEGELDTVRNLLKLGFSANFSFNNQMAIDLAYNKKHFDVVLELLRNHSPYPKNFSTEGISDELKSFVNLSKSLHEAIKHSNVTKLLEILAESSNQKFFYDTENNSALSCAIKHKSFEAYEHLINNYLSFSPLENIEDILDFLEGDEQAQDTLKRINEKHSKSLLNKHISVLISNSCIGFDNEKDPAKFSSIVELFEELNKNPTLSLLLKLVATAKNFKIIFDFNRDFVRFMNPRDGKHANGLFTFNGTILIAAKDLMVPGQKFKTYGVVAHELCHFALNLTFENFALPYAKDDTDADQNFNQIIFNCYSRKDIEEIVRMAFEDHNVIRQELAVRYCHMLAHYIFQPQVLHEKLSNFIELKEFHDEKVVPAMQEALRKLEAKNSLKYWKDLNDQEKKLVKDTLIDFSGVKVKFKELFRSSSVYEVLSPRHIDLALKNDASGLNEAFSKICHLKIDLTWENCAKALKDKILNTKLDFQGDEVELGKILDSDSKVLNELNSAQIKNLIEGESLEIGLKFSKEDVELIITRSFKIISKGTEKILSMNDAVEEAFKEGIFLLIDGPGTGKTTTFKSFPEIAKKLFPSFWVAFVNLKEHSEIYKKAITTANENFANLIGEKILKLKNLDLKVFCELYEKGKIAFVWDAFDEVGKTFHEFLFKFFAKIKNETKNVQFLSSRPEHQKELSDAFTSKVFGLIPFDEVDRGNFLKDQLKDLLEEDQKQIHKKIEKIIEKVEWRVDARDVSDRSVNNPLMLGIIAEILKGDETVELKNRFKLYEKFIKKQIRSVKDVDRLQLLFCTQNMTFYEIHQFYALKLIFGESFPEVENLELLQKKITLSPNEIASFGLMVATSDGQLDFIHKTIAEFFVALYFVEKVFQMTENVAIEEIALRIKLTSKFFFDLINVIWFFLYEFLSESHEIYEWNPKILQTARTEVSKYYTEENFDSELVRRLLMKDFETFEKYLNKKYGNVLNYLSKRCGITIDDTEKLSKHINDPKLVLEEFKRNHQIGNIKLNIWFNFQFGDYSKAFLANRHTGLNLNEKALNELKNIKTFMDFYNYICKELTKEENEKMLRNNFLRSIPFWGSQMESLQEIWKFFTKTFNEDEIKSMLLKEDKENWNVLFVLLKYSHANINSVNFMLAKFEKLLTKNSIKALIRSQNKNFHSPTLFAANCGSIEILKSYWNFVQKYLSEEEQKYHLLFEFYKDKSFYDVCTIREFFYNLIPEEEVESTKSLLKLRNVQ